MYFKRCNERKMSDLYAKPDHLSFSKNGKPCFSVIIISDYEFSPFTRSELTKLNILPIICYFGNLQDYPTPRIFNRSVLHDHTSAKNLIYAREICPFSEFFVHCIKKEYKRLSAGCRLNILNYILEPKRLAEFRNVCCQIEKIKDTKK